MFGPLDRLSNFLCSTECKKKFQKGRGNKKKGRKYPHLQRSETKKCFLCQTLFRSIKDHKNKKQKYCSLNCCRKDWRRKMSPVPNSAYLRGIDNHEWKGEQAGYTAKHRWVDRLKGTPSLCEHCGTDKAKKFEWANIDHKYRRNLDDYIRLCTRCHRKYDMENNGYEINIHHK